VGEPDRRIANMRKVMVLLAILTLVGSVNAADIARGPQVVEGTPTPHENDLRGTDVLIVSVIRDIFTDMAPIYAAAFEANGWTVSIVYDPMGNWDPTDYDMVLFSTADNWWDDYDYGPDFEVFGAYLDGGGCGVVVGQDFLYSSELWGGMNFLMTYFGVLGVVQDVNFGDASAMEWFGEGNLEGIYDVMFPCFDANPWFTDDVAPMIGGVAQWCTDLACGQGGSHTGITMCSVVEFGCSNVVNDVVLVLMDKCKPTPTEETTWGQIKSLFR
jgi:hypothetical protein